MHDELVPRMGARWSHAISSAAFLAGATRDIGLLPLIVLPYHEPIDLAKSLATIDRLSGGRLTIIGGTGYMAWEFATLGVAYEDRSSITDEYLEAMVELWTSAAPAFHGRHVRFADVTFDPKPVQPPHPPILLGGYARSALRRVARHGDGWVVQKTTSRTQLAADLAYIHEQPEFQARPRFLDVGAPLWEVRVDPNTHQVLEPIGPSTRRQPSSSRSSSSPSSA